MAFENWQKSADGNLLTNPLMGYDLASFRTHGIARLQFADSPQDVDRNTPLSLQLGMTADQARELGEGLIRLASEIDRWDG